MTGATTDGRTSRPAFEIQTGWLILVAGFDGDEPSWLQTGAVKHYDAGVRLYFVNGEMSVLLANDEPCTVAGHHKAVA